MKRPKGPDLKMPDVKVPDFLADVYYDLRDRRLLPLVALVVVATAAVPFLLGDSEQPAVPPVAANEGAAEAEVSKLTVVEATPGLRGYSKRLKGRTPTDPFAQRFTAPAGGGAASSGGDEASSSSSPASYTEEPVTPESPGSSTGGAGGDGGSPGDGGASPGGSSGGDGSAGSGGKPGLVLFDYAIDVRISRSGAPPEEPVVKHKVLPQTPLPGEKAPVVTYMGPGRKGDNKATGKVLLLVSGDVTAISGESRCVSRTEGGVCQLLEAEPGFPLTFDYGTAGVHYTIKVLNLELVVTGRT